LSDAELLALDHDWQFWGRKDQLPPPQPWSIWMCLAGRGWGKTRTGAEWIRSIACGPTPLSKGSARRIALVAETAADGRDVLVEGESGILSVHPKEFRPLYEPSKRRLTWPNGTKATLYNGTEPEQLRGPQHDHAWLDELAKWRYAEETWDQLQFGMRLGEHPRQMITTTPRPIPIVRKLLAMPSVHVTRGSTYDNRSNLAPSFFQQVVSRYEGTRLGRQEINAEILSDVPNALWTRAILDSNRVRTLPHLRRIAIAIDPSGHSEDDDSGDLAGICVFGVDIRGVGYVIADASCHGGPLTWARAAVNAYHEYEADVMIAETNFGGAMVEHTIRTVDKRVKFVQVTASRGKHIRAEPVAALYEKGQIKHLGNIPLLEDQLCFFTTGGYIGDRSPDRADAMIWAASHLMLAPMRKASTKDIS
jgi:phage terminase large subunit-like protein